MNEVQRAIHIRTGQRAAADAIDQWLARHGVATTPFGDVYAACAHLLHEYDSVPDLVFVGADWLVDDELTIIAYVHQIWPRAGVVIYGTGAAMPRIDLLPMMHAVRVEDLPSSLLHEPPATLARRLLDRAAALTAPGHLRVPARAALGRDAGNAAETEQRPGTRASLPSAESALSGRPSELENDRHTATDLDELLNLLSDEELSALLDEPEEDRRR